MAALPLLSGEAVCRALGRAGFYRKSQKGSHVKMRHADGRSAIVPTHDEVAPGTLRSILKQARVTPDEFARLLGRASS
jgi:predicted RNA binding protein YcfA (HicA-like mRNA interferase family)